MIWTSSLGRNEESNGLWFVHAWPALESSFASTPLEVAHGDLKLFCWTRKGAFRVWFALQLKWLLVVTAE